MREGLYKKSPFGQERSVSWLNANGLLGLGWAESTSGRTKDHVVIYLYCNGLVFLSLLRVATSAFFGDVASRRLGPLDRVRSITSGMFGKTKAGAAREPLQG